MSEMAQTADHLIVIGKGRLIADIGVTEFVRQGQNILVARRRDRSRSPAAWPRPAPPSPPGADGALIVTGLEAREVGKAALDAGVILTELTPQRSLEQAYMDLTRDSVEFRTERGMSAAKGFADTVRSRDQVPRHPGQHPHLAVRPWCAWPARRPHRQRARARRTHRAGRALFDATHGRGTYGDLLVRPAHRRRAGRAGGDPRVRQTGQIGDQHHRDDRGAAGSWRPRWRHTG